MLSIIPRYPSKIVLRTSRALPESWEKRTTLPRSRHRHPASPLTRRRQGGQVRTRIKTQSAVMVGSAPRPCSVCNRNAPSCLDCFAKAARTCFLLSGPPSLPARRELSRGYLPPRGGRHSGRRRQRPESAWVTCSSTKPCLLPPPFGDARQPWAETNASLFFQMAVL